MSKNYIALFHKQKYDEYGIVFPDFPGCVAVGDNFEDALRRAAEALAFHVQGMREDKQRIPKARTLEDIHAAKESWIDWKSAIVAVVPLLPATGKTARVQITMDERLLSRIDAVSSNRSAFLAEAAMQRLENSSGKLT